MKTRISQHSKNLSLFMVIVLALLLSNCKNQYSIELQSKIGSIEGKIEDYNGKYKSGKLIYFDAISRIVHNEIFEIDSLGCFKVSFKIPHPLYDASNLELQGHNYQLFLEPGKDLKIIIRNRTLEYFGDNGSSNIQIKILEDTIKKRFKKEIEHCLFLHETNIGYKEYLKEISNLSKIKLDFINKFEKTHEFNDVVINAIKKQVYYSAAKSWINFRFDYSNKRPEKRDTLFKNFYEDLFKAYPINDRNALLSREYIDYIANIKTAFSEREPYDSLINFIQNSNSFSELDMNLITRSYKGDTSVYRTKEFKQFNNANSIKKLTDLSNRYRVGKLLTFCEKMPQGIGRDLIISQGLCSYYFSNSYLHPTEKEWKRINGLIESKFILDYLLDLENTIKTEKIDNKTLNEIPETVKKLAVDLNKKLIEKYKGKVVYIDFWATWCGPCVSEIPDTKVLIKQFKDRDFVFLSLCCKSSEDIWKKMVALEKLQGDQRFVNDIEFDLLSALYKVSSFPTYILLDKTGNIVNYNAPRPSSKELLYIEINKLIE